MMTGKSGEINLKVNVDKEEVDDAMDDLKELTDNKPNITIRNNQNVYVTMNYFNQKEQRGEDDES